MKSGSEREGSNKMQNVVDHVSSSSYCGSGCRARSAASASAAALLRFVARLVNSCSSGSGSGSGCGPASSSSLSLILRVRPRHQAFSAPMRRRTDTETDHDRNRPHDTIRPEQKPTRSRVNQADRAGKTHGLMGTVGSSHPSSFASMTPAPPESN